MTWPSRWKNLQAGFATSKLHLSAPKEKAPRGRSEEGEGRAELASSVSRSKYLLVPLAKFQQRPRS